MSSKIYNRKEQKHKRKSLRNNSTVSENVLWSYLKNKKLGVKFRRQHGIGNYIVDFYCPELKLAVEIDGATHETEKEVERDYKKEEFLKEQGVELKRYTNVDVKNGVGGVVEDLMDFIEKRKQNWN
ncbi:MAG TPA: endonuclease domain-containing protein [Patescibacteria group bacterium]|nr:endonuclease domain-containing protein [Patescibacteria group bacterium]